MGTRTFGDARQLYLFPYVQKARKHTICVCWCTRQQVYGTRLSHGSVGTGANDLNVSPPPALLVHAYAYIPSNTRTHSASLPSLPPSPLPPNIPHKNSSDDWCLMCVKLFPPLPDPPPVWDSHVPVFVCDIDEFKSVTWDLTMQTVRMCCRAHVRIHARMGVSSLLRALCGAVCARTKCSRWVRSTRLAHGFGY